MSCFAIGSSTITRLRERRGPITSKLGFSVVAPIRVIRPVSTCGKKASCWALLKRCISSTNKIVGPPSRRFSSARLIIVLTSASPADTALISIKSALVALAIILAKVVLPLPGGPHSSKLTSRFCFIIWRITWPLPSKCCCPTISSIEDGRSLSARGSGFMY